MTDANSITNFNFGFSTHKSDVLIHLSQWQYWWWFWFSLFWVMYFFIILRVVNRRTMQFNPIINTSIRGHGKWGDFLVALIPLSWCGNILVNSNFILRMIEWQNEGSLFTLRVIGRQWYWEYRYDSSAVASIFSAPKNIGHNRWFFTYANESYCSDSYYQALTLGMQLEYKKAFYAKLNEKHNLNANILSQLRNKGASYTTGGSLISKISVKENLYAPSSIMSGIKRLNKYTNIFTRWTPLKLSKVVGHKLSEEYALGLYNAYSLNIIDDRTHHETNIALSVKKKPFSIINGVLNKHNINLLKQEAVTLEKPIMFVAKFFRQNGTPEPKVEMTHLFWGFRQKRFVRKKFYKFKDKLAISPDFVKEITQKNYSKKLVLPELESSDLVDRFSLKSNLTIDHTAKNHTKNALRSGNSVNVNKLFTQRLSDEMGLESYSSLWHYNTSVKFNRHRGELVPVNLARRLLRTKRILVLPAHVNITVVTNSNDVVHSWFIPGLGIKLDCVPGRSTHHTFYIDNVGLYYGQCAEICGRYHHHMPIRLCALPFEQFLVWWQKKGLRRFHRLPVVSKRADYNVDDIKFRYKW